MYSGIVVPTILGCPVVSTGTNSQTYYIYHTNFIKLNQPVLVTGWLYKLTLDFIYRYLAVHIEGLALVDPKTIKYTDRYTFDTYTYFTVLIEWYTYL